MTVYRERFFGEPWPSSVCDDGVQVPMPVGELCICCGEPVVEGDRGLLMLVASTSALGRLPADFNVRPQHRECGLRAVVGGIGHLEDHARWCPDDPDGGRTYRQSALEVWDWVQRLGV